MLLWRIVVPGNQHTTRRDSSDAQTSKSSGHVTVRGTAVVNVTSQRNIKTRAQSVVGRLSTRNKQELAISCSCFMSVCLKECCERNTGGQNYMY